MLGLCGLAPAALRASSFLLLPPSWHSCGCLAPGRVGQSTGISGIAVKADAVRIIGRNSVKIIGGTDKYKSVSGSGTVTRITIQAAKKGFSQSKNIFKGNYKLN